MTTGIFLTNGQWRPYPQGYEYKADWYCPDCIVPVLGYGGHYAFSVEEILENLARRAGVDYSDEYSYDSDDFPKCVTDLTERRDCARCHTNLLET